MVKPRRSRRHMAGARGPLLAELMGQGEEEGEGRRSKEGPPATQSVAPPSPGATAETSKPPATGSPARSSGSGSPEPNCAICLGKLENKSFTDSCFHMFCFVCLLEWSKVKPECPLCKQKFKSIVHNVRSYDDYQQYHLDRQSEAQPAQPANPWENPEGPRFRYRTTMMVGPFQGVLDLIHTYSNRPFTNPARHLNPETTSSGSSWIPPFEVPRREAATSSRDRPLDLTNTQTARQHWRNRRCLATSEFRRRVYSSNLRVVNVRDENNKHRLVTPAFFESNPGATHRLIPWLNRELNALLTVETHSQFVLELIMGLINRFPIQSEEFYQHLQPYLGRNTRHFMDEFHSFARSPFNMAVYDTKAMYREALPEVLDSDSSEDTDDVVVIVSSSSSEEEEDQRARDPSRQAVDDLHGRPSWDSPTPGPSWDSSPERPERNRTNVSAPSIATSSTAPNVSWSLGTSSMSSSGIKSESPAAPSSDSDSDSSSSDVEVDDDVLVVAMEKPWRERSPIVLSSASEDERPPVLERESQEAQPPLKLRFRKSRSDRDRDYERSHQSRHGSDPHSSWRHKSRSRSRSPVVSSTRYWQIDNQCRSRSSHNNHCDDSTSYHARSARSREHYSRRTRSKSKESRSRSHRHSKSRRSSHSPKSGKKRHHTGSRSNSLEATSSKRKKSKHKKHKKHKKHGKHKQDKKKEEKTSKRSRHRHRSKRSEGGRDEAAAALQQLADAGSNNFSSHQAAASASVGNAGCRELPTEPSASTESVDLANFTEAGSNLEVAMEIDVGSTSVDESHLINCSESSADVIAISSEDDDDCIEVVAEVEQAPSSTERNSAPLPLSLEATASRPLQRSSWNTPISIDSDDGRPGLFSQLGGDPLLSSAATASDPMLSASVSSPQSIPGLAFSGASSTCGRSTLNSNPRAAIASDSSTATSSVPASSCLYRYINECVFPSRSSLHVGGQLENGSTTLSGSPSASCALSVELPKWESVRRILPCSTAGCSSSSTAACSASMEPSSTAGSSQSSSCTGLPGSADKMASAGFSTAAQEPPLSTGALPEVNPPRSPSPGLPDNLFNFDWDVGALEHCSAGCSAPTPEESSAAGTMVERRNSPPSARDGRALNPVNNSSSLPMTGEGTLKLLGEENSAFASSEDESSCESESSDDAMQIVDAPLDVPFLVPVKSPETITSSEDEEGHVSARQQQIGSDQPAVENDVHQNLTPADGQVDGEDEIDDAVSSDEESSWESLHPARTELGQPGGNRNNDGNVLPTDDHVDEEEEEKIDTENSNNEDESDNERDDASCPDQEDQYMTGAGDDVDNQDERSDAEGCASGSESEGERDSANCYSEEEDNGEISEDERRLVVQAMDENGAVNEEEEDHPTLSESEEEGGDDVLSVRNDGFGDDEVGDGGEDYEAEEDADSASEAPGGTLANASDDSDSNVTCTNSDVE